MLGEEGTGADKEKKTYRITCVKSSVQKQQTGWSGINIQKPCQPSLDSP